MIQLLTPILLLIVLYIFLNVYKNHKTKRSKINLPPGSFGWPFLGESLALLRACWDGVPERFVQERIKKHDSPLVFKTSLLGERMAVMCGPAGNKFLFGNENRLVGVWWPSQVRKLFGRCLITSRGDEAKWMRKMLLSYLGPDAFVTHYAATMDAVTRRHIEIHWRGKEEVKVFQTVKVYAFELACRLFMSLEEPNHIAKLGSLFNIFLKGILELPINIPGTRFYSANKAAAAIRTELMMIIKARRVELEEGKVSSSQDLLSHLLTSSDENGRYLTEKDIANNILLLLFAGHDTSTVAITLLIKSLGEHPDVYDKVLQEQLEISKAKEAGELLKWEDIQKMKYSWNVVSEVMRLNPPATGAFREALVDIEYAGYTIPKGWKIYWSSASTHKDKANFEDVTRFDPSRFEGAGPTPFTYVPFGGGPRMCLGKEFSRMEILAFLHNIVTNFKWDLMIPDEKIEYDPMATPVKGITRHPFRPSSKPISPIPIKPITTKSFHPFCHPTTLPPSRFNKPLYPQFNICRSYNVETDKVVDEINLKFAEAREEIEMAMESKETVYFNEEAECARAVVKEVLEMYAGLLSKLPEKERGGIQRSMGLKIEQLKAELEQLNE